jgi:2-haloacid dehalogenase
MPAPRRDSLAAVRQPSGTWEASELSEAFCVPETPGAVVFDIGRVLFEWDLRHLYAKLIADPAELDWFLTHVVTETWHYQADGGRPLAEMVPERIATFPDHAHLIEAYLTRFNESIPGPVAGAHAIVRRLAAAGVPLYALTNFGAEFFAGFRPTQPIFDLFADIVVSGVERCAKPDGRIYEIAEARIGLPPGRLFFIDDSPANVEAAAARGWQAHHFTDAAALEHELAACGLLA